MTETTPSVLVTVRLTTPVAASVAVPCSGLVTPCALATAPGGIVLMRLPETLPRTVTASVQIEFALTLALASVTVVPLLTAVIAAPLQPAPVNVGAGGFATTIPAGRVSVKPTPVRLIAPALLLRIWIDIVDVPPTATVVGLNDLLTVTDVLTSTRFAAAAALVTPSVVVTALAGIVLVCVPVGPATGVATSSATVHDVLAAPPARLPPVSEKLVVPDVAVTVPAGARGRRVRRRGDDEARAHRRQQIGEGDVRKRRGASRSRQRDGERVTWCPPAPSPD